MEAKTIENNQAEWQSLARELRRVRDNLIVSWPAFGPFRLNDFGIGYSNESKGKKILEELSKYHLDSKIEKLGSFREPTTFESISAIAYYSENATKSGMLDLKFNIGNVVRTSEGIFTNTKITDEKILKQLLGKAEKFNGIYLIDDKIAFAPYETFKEPFSSTKFGCGLARALEHTRENRAETLFRIANCKEYNLGCNLDAFDYYTYSPYMNDIEGAKIFNINVYTSHHPAGRRISFVAEDLNSSCLWQKDLYVFGVKK